MARMILHRTKYYVDGKLVGSRIDLPGQMELPQTEERQGAFLKMKASSPMQSVAPQKPCDIGLFSDEANQTDLIEMLMNPHE
jgi:hypothetical protein